MRKPIQYIGFILLLVLLASCGDEPDFKDANWGMTMQEVVKIEEKNDNNLYEEESDEDEIELIYEDLSINGFEADVHYQFKNSIDKAYALTPADYNKSFANFEKKLANDKLSEDEKQKMVEEFSRENQDLIDEYNDLPSEFPLTDVILVEGRYYFWNLDENDSEQLLKSLKEKYGKPIAETPDAYFWETDRSRIYFDGDDYISYTAKFKAVDKFIKDNFGESKNNSL